MAKKYPFKYGWLYPDIQPMNEDEWFKSHQSLLLRMANTSEGRELLCIDQDFSKIDRFAKNYISTDLGDGKRKTEFHCGAKWANVIRFRWLAFSSLSKKFYNAGGKTWIKIDGDWKLAATTSEFFPDPDSEGSPTTVDGYSWRQTAAAGEAFSTLRGGLGSNTTQSSVILFSAIRGGSTSNLYQRIYRQFTLFDTSSITDSDSIDSADYDLYFEGTSNDVLSGASSGNSRHVLVETTPASDVGLLAADYDSGHYLSAGGVNLGEGITQAALVSAGVGYNDTITVNGSGLALINKTGITKFGVAKKWDFDNTVVGLTWATGFQAYTFSSADETGTTQDPKLTVIHSAVATAQGRRRRSQNIGGSYAL